MAPYIRPHHEVVPAKLATQLPVSTLLPSLDLQDHGSNANEVGNHSHHHHEDENKIATENCNYLSHEGIENKQLHHQTSLNENKNLGGESNRREGDDHKNLGNDGGPRRYHASPSLDYFAKLRNPKTRPYRYHKTVPKRIHSRQFSVSPEIDQFSQSHTATSTKSKDYPLEISEHVFEPHTHDTNYLSLFPGLQLSDSKQSSPTTSEIHDTYSDLAFAGNEAGEYHATEHTHPLMVPPQFHVAKIEAPTGITRWSDVSRLAANAHFSTAEFARGVEITLPLLFLAIWLFCLWKVAKICWAWGGGKSIGWGLRSRDQWPLEELEEGEEGEEDRPTMRGMVLLVGSMDYAENEEEEDDLRDSSHNERQQAFSLFIF